MAVIAYSLSVGMSSLWIVLLWMTAPCPKKAMAGRNRKGGSISEAAKSLA